MSEMPKVTSSEWRSGRSSVRLRRKYCSAQPSAKSSRNESGSVSSASTFSGVYGHQGYDSYRIHSKSTKDHAMFLGDFRPSERRNVTRYRLSVTELMSVGPVGDVGFFMPRRNCTCASFVRASSTCC